MKINLNKIIIILGSIALTSCQTLTNIGLVQSKNDAIISVQNHQNFLNSSREYKKCIDEGHFFDRKASQSKDNSLSLYSKSADILSKCELILGDYTTIVSDEERMKNNALSIQNYLKSGRLKVASRSLEQFKNKFNKDLIYPDGSSFTKNAESILDFSNDKGSLNLEMTNNNQKIKSELKRAWYWIKK